MKYISVVKIVQVNIPLNILILIKFVLNYFIIGINLMK